MSMKEDKKLKIRCLHCTIECNPISTSITTNKGHHIFYEASELLEWLKKYLEEHEKLTKTYIIDESRTVYTKEAVHKEVEKFLTPVNQA